MTLKTYLRILRKRWLTVINCAVLGVLIASIITILIPRVYAAHTTNFVSTAVDGTQPASLYQNSQFALGQVASYTQVVHSPSVLQPVINDLHLNMTTNELDKRITAANPTGTVIIDVKATSSTARQAQAIADSVSRHLDSAIEALETPRAGGPSPVKVSIAVPAKVPSAPVSPRTPLNVALGLLIGLAIGIATAVLREQFDTTLKSPEDLQVLAGLTPLGVIDYEPQIKERPLVALERNSSGVEAFRSIRSNLQFANVDRPPRQVVITSAIADEGKTVTACNLAITMAQATLRVCLLEADLRRPKAAQYLGLTGGVGLTNVVAGQHVLDDVLVPWNRGQLTVLPAGTTPPDPSQLLGSDAMAELLADLRSRFDMVIIDAPPLLPVSDAAVLSRTSDGAILVARYGHVRREQVSRALVDLSTIGAQLIGTILTCAPAKERVKRYGPDYSYTTDKYVSPERREWWLPGDPALKNDDITSDDARSSPSTNDRDPDPATTRRGKAGRAFDDARQH